MKTVYSPHQGNWHVVSTNSGATIATGATPQEAQAKAAERLKDRKIYGVL